MSIYISSEYQFQNPPQSEEEKLKRAHIGYKSIVTPVNIVASSQAAGFPVSGLANPLTAERWKPVALPATLTVDNGSVADVDYVGMASHTFARDSVSIVIEHSADNITWTAIKDLSPGTNRPIFSIFKKVSARYWRVTLNNETGNIPSIGVLYIGLSLVMQRGIFDGHTPITMGRKTKRIQNKTEGGQYAGVSIINEGVEGSYSWSDLTSSWYREYFDPFVVYARSNPFFISWRPSEYQNEAGYMWSGGDIVPTQQTGGANGLMSVSMNVSGYSDE